ncbi:MAG: hypothetical protein R3A44_40475 [Caldilineaceae bacterium]
MTCNVCNTHFEKKDALATQVYRRNGVVVTVTGIPAVAVCPNCGNAVLEWETAQEVEDLVLPLFQWVETHTLPKPVVTITFPESVRMAA